LLLLGSVFTLIYPVATLGFETADSSTMKAQPWNVGSKLFDVKRLLSAAVIGIGLALPTFFVFLINRNTDYASSSALTAFMLTMVFYMLSSRSEELFYKRLFHNRFLSIISGICVFAVLLVAATPIGAIFGLNPMGVTGWLTSILLPLIVPVAFECLKVIKPLISK
jgi:magnesium-transporting ATPase (P-type)